MPCRSISMFVKFQLKNVFLYYLGDSLKSVEPAKAAKWKKYLDLKAAFYQSYVRTIICIDLSLFYGLLCCS